uniref:Uncharacterized protein LOC111110476 isoform X3 n=1 Tax=Crassostrea virginica TaxID=6565 RepID=A0A8B8BHE5_CRAVI|nr:uncharacterized protein LOC111110476 isoform X3 [Crassostrea virginica]
MITKSVAIVLTILVNMTPYESAVLPKWVHRIPSCPDPGNVSQWMEASRKLYCQNQLSFDDPKQQGHQYHCLPSSFLNETVEFCGRSVPIGPGACAVYSYEFFANTQPTSYNCSKFTSGCPNQLIFSKNMYKYPDCLNISKSEKCFRAEKNCSYNSNNSVITTDITLSHPSFPDSSSLDIMLKVLSVLITVPLVLIIPLICFRCWRKKRKGFKISQNMSQLEQEKLLEKGDPPQIEIEMQDARKTDSENGDPPQIEIEMHDTRKTDSVENGDPPYIEVEMQDARKTDSVENGDPPQIGIEVPDITKTNNEQDTGGEDTHPEYGITELWKRAKLLDENEFLKDLKEAMTTKNFRLIKSKLIESTEDTEEKQALTRISKKGELLNQLKKHCSLFHNLTFLQGLFLASKAEPLYQRCVSHAERRGNDKILFFKRKKKIGCTEVKYKIHCPFLKNNELTELTETIRCLTGAEYNDIYVSEVNNGCVKVCFMVRNHLIPKLRKCYMPENINNTHQSLSKDLRNKIIKVVIQDEVVDLSDVHRFGNILKLKDHDVNSKGISTQVSVKHCSLCPKDTEYYCYKCQQDLCIQCKKLHVIDLSSKHHIVTSYAEKRKYPPKPVKTLPSQDPKQVISARSEDPDNNEPCVMPFTEYKPHKFIPLVWLSPLERIEIQRQQYSSRIYHLRGETIYYRSVLLEELRSDRDIWHKAVSIRGKSEAVMRGQTLKYMIDEVLAGDLEDRRIIQRTRMTRHMIKLQKYYLRYIQLGETMETRPIKFLRIMTRKPQKDDMKPIITMLVNLMKEIRLVPSRIPRRAGVKDLLTMMSTPVLQKSLTLKFVNNCGHVSSVTPDRVWVSDDDNNLILIDTALGNILHSVNDSLHEAVCGKHTVNCECELLYIDEEENIIKLCNDMQTTTTILKHTDPTKEPMSVFCSPFSGDLLVGFCIRDTDSDTKEGAIIMRFDKRGKRKQRIPHYDNNSLFGSPRFISENNNGDVVVSDWDLHAVVVTSGKGVHRFSYVGPPKRQRIDPGGICTDVQSHILVCDGITKTIQMLDGDGQFLSYLLWVQDKPVTLSYDYNSHRLLVGSVDNKLSIYQYINRYLHLIDNTEFYDSSIRSETFKSQNIPGFSQEEFDLLNIKPEADNEEEYPQIIAEQKEEEPYKAVYEAVEKKAEKAAKKAKRAAEIVEKIALKENEHATKQAAARAKEIKAEAETWKNFTNVLILLMKKGRAALKNAGRWRKETIKH